jgi:hypothetical protein
MAEVNTSAAEDQGGEPLLADKDEELGQSELPTQEAPEPSRHQEPIIPDSSGGGAEVPPPPLPASERASTGWSDEMEEALTGSSIAEVHRVLMGTVLQSLRSVDNGLKEACRGLLNGFKVSNVMAFP